MDNTQILNRIKEIRTNASSPSPKPVWGIHRPFRCPVIGACISLEEHKKLLKKLGYRIKGCTSYQIHKTIMGNLDEENRVSLKLDSYLRHKYRQDIGALFDLDAEQFMEKWRSAFRDGQIEGPFYVAAIRSDLSEEELTEIFGEIHMLSHANLGELMKARQHAALQTEANGKLAKLLKQQKEREKKLRLKNSRLKRVSLESQHAAARPQKSVNEAPRERMIREMEAEKAVLKENFAAFEKQKAAQVNFLEKENQRLQKENADLNDIRQKLADEMQSLISQFSWLRCEAGGNEACPKFQLCARRILIVGGLTRIKHLYKHLIESAGGEFEYHDGYMKNGSENLEVRVRRSDLIICPVDCNSHGAALNVKKLCRKHNKTVRMIPSSSLSAISNTLFEQAKAEVSQEECSGECCSCG